LQLQVAESGVKHQKSNQIYFVVKFLSHLQGQFDIDLENFKTKTKTYCYLKNLCGVMKLIQCPNSIPNEKKKLIFKIFL
jgi:hypothetical protein